MLTTTLNDIRKHSPCAGGWENLLAHLGKTKADAEPVSFETILDSNGLDDALWCLRALPDDMDNNVRQLACDLAEPTLKFTDDPRPREAVEMARRFARGEATGQELAAARAAAGAAAWTAAWTARDAAWGAARDAVWADQERLFRAWITAQ